MSNENRNSANNEQQTPADGSNCTRFALSYEVFLFFLVGICGVCGEVFFYTLVKIGRLIPLVGEIFFGFEWRVDARLQLAQIWSAPVETLFGQCSLWMLPVYAGATLYVVRPLYRLLREQSFLIRAAVYGVGILLFEGACGVFYETVLRFAVWTYADSGAIFGGATSVKILPLWMLVGLLTERVGRETANPIWRGAFQARLTEILEQSHAVLSFVCLLAELADFLDNWRTTAIHRLRSIIEASSFTSNRERDKLILEKLHRQKFV